MKIAFYIVEISGTLYGSFATEQQAAEYAKKNLLYGWSIRPVYEPPKGRK